MSLLAKLVNRSSALFQYRITLNSIRDPVRNLATVADSPLFPFAEPSAPGIAKTPASLFLKTGQAYKGISFGADKSASGEAVFTTSLVGYPESMTDPSYRGQMLVFTQPLIGNYGVPAQMVDSYDLFTHFESSKIQVSGIIVNDYATQYSHWTAVQSLGQWCRSQGIPAISGVDTRAITQLLREQGSTLSRLAVGDDANKTHGIVYENPNDRNLVAEVSTKEPYVVNPNGDLRIAVIDCGVKHNIIRCLATRNAAVTVLPWDYDFNAIANEFDGLFISNGPGDPSKCTATVDTLRGALQTFNRPIFGICMGNLLLGTAAGMSTYKLRYGNRGHNQPAINVTNGRCAITSQNHGYALDDRVMPDGWERYWVNANDGSNEGIRHRTKPIFSVQFHPEAKGGPQDTQYLFSDFIDTVRLEKARREGLNVFVPEQIEEVIRQVAVA